MTSGPHPATARPARAAPGFRPVPHMRQTAPGTLAKAPVKLNKPWCGCRPSRRTVSESSSRGSHDLLQRTEFQLHRGHAPARGPHRQFPLGVDVQGDAGAADDLCRRGGGPRPRRARHRREFHGPGPGGGQGRGPDLCRRLCAGDPGRTAPGRRRRRPAPRSRPRGPFRRRRPAALAAALHAARAGALHAHAGCPAAPVGAGPGPGLPAGRGRGARRGRSRGGGAELEETRRPAGQRTLQPLSRPQAAAWAGHP